MAYCVTKFTSGALEKIQTITYMKTLCRRYKSRFAHVEMGKPDPILGLGTIFKKDPNPNKILLGVGAFRDENGKPWVLPSVRLAERQVIEECLDKEYLPISGNPDFNKAAVKLALGDTNEALARTATVQSISGTGGVCLGMESVVKFLEAKDIYLPNPTWPNHFALAQHARLQTKEYRYYDPKTKNLDFKGLCDDLCNAPKGSIILFHVAGHNPTGVDPNIEQWKEISAIIKRNELFPFLDMAYQGFASGDLNKDAEPLRMMIKDGHQLGFAQSFSKNMGLYGERVGTLNLVTESAEEAARIVSQINQIVRSMYSSPPLHGARIATKILTSEELYKHWLCEVKKMANRIKQCRQSLKENLIKLGSQHNWDHITNQIGMFGYTGLTPEQVERFAKEFSVYLTKDGRMSISGITTKNVEYLANAMHEVTKSKSQGSQCSS